MAHVLYLSKAMRTGCRYDGDLGQGSDELPKRPTSLSNPQVSKPDLKLAQEYDATSTSAVLLDGNQLPSEYAAVF